MKEEVEIARRVQSHTVMEDGVISCDKLGTCKSLTLTIGPVVNS